MSINSLSCQKTRTCMREEATETTEASDGSALSRAAAQRVPSSVEEVARFIRNSPGIPLLPAQADSCAEHFFLEMEAVGWRFKGNAVANWRALVTSYASRWAQNERKKTITFSKQNSTNKPSYYGLK